MKTIKRICFIGIVLVVPALAQNIQSGPSPAVAGPAFNVSVGYAHLNMDFPGASRANLGGVDVSGSVDLSQRWGATVDSSYVVTPHVLGTPHDSYLATIHGGPVFYPIQGRNTRVFVRALAGLGVVDGAIPLQGTEYFHGWLTRFSYVIGAGVEHSVTGPLAIRFNGDYLRTSFYNASEAVQPQNNLRLTVSLVFRLREHQHRSGTQVW